MVMVGIEEIKEVSPKNPTLKVIGVGGGGGNAINRMINYGLKSVDFIAANTDLQDLKNSLAPYKLQIGNKCTRGLGAGAKPDQGREAALEDMETIREHLMGSDMVFITAGLGGGTGTGASPIIAEIAREIGALTVGVVTKPFKFEGKVRMRNGEDGIVELRKHVDTLIVIPNDNLLLLANKKTSILDAFTMADDVLRIAVQGISDLINNEGLINLDFADVHTVMYNKGQAIMGTGVGNGDNRAIEAAERAIRSPLLEDTRIDGAKGILINVTGSSSLSLHEVNEAASFIADHADDDANIIFGATIDETMDPDQLEVTVIATGFGGAPGVGSVRHLAAARAEPSPFKALIEEQDFADEPAREGREEEDGEPEPMETLQAFRMHFEEENPQAAPETGTDFPADPLSTGAADEDGDDFGDSEVLDEEVLELENPIIETIETTPQIPSSYRPAEKSSGRAGNPKEDMDIPAFIRRRNERFQDE